MGLCCEINLFKPVHGFYQPGQTVSGVIKYALDDPMDVDAVITSLKGIGQIILIEDPDSKWETSYETTEMYVDIDHVIQAERVKLAAGSYEVNFNFIIPRNVPSSMKFRKSFRDYKVKCSIKYYVRIKFERPGLFAFNKHYRKEIEVVSRVLSTLPREPAVYRESKKLMHLFSSKDSIVKIKATIVNSVVPVGGKIELEYEVLNESHVVIKSIMTKLVQALTFKAKGYRRVTYETDIPDTDGKSTSINCHDFQIMAVNIRVPPNLCSMGNANIVFRHYFIRITAQLPIPHKNAVLDIPVDIGALEESELESTMVQEHQVNYNDPPPTYWEAMGEANKEFEDYSDDDTDTRKLVKSKGHSSGEGSKS